MGGSSSYLRVLLLMLSIAAAASPVWAGVPEIEDWFKEIEFDSDAKPLEVALIRAAFHKDLPTLKRLVEANPGIVNAHPAVTISKGMSSDNGWSALGWAVKKNQHEMADFLIKHGANIRHTERRCPILCMVKDTRMAKLLIDNGADVNVGNPLIYIWDGGAVRLLLEKGAKVDGRDDASGVTALMTSATYDNLEAAKVLVEYKANVNLKNSRGETPLQMACRTGDLTFVKLLIDHGADVLAADREGYSPICCAAAGWGWGKQYAEIIQLLVQHGVSLKQKTKSGETLLHLAVRAHLLETAKYLLDAGLEVNATQKDGMTPLHYAVKYSCEDTDTEIVKLLIQRGANVNAKTRDTIVERTGNSSVYVQKVVTPLAYASIVAHRETIQTAGIPGLYEDYRDRIKRTNRTRKAIAELIKKYGAE
jgi:ankyrin repeat protein